MLATWPISPLAWLAKQALFPAAPLEGGSLHSAMPALWVFEGHIWMLPLIALTAVAVGGVMGGVMQLITKIAVVAVGAWGMRNLDVVWLGWPASFVAGTVVPYFCFQKIVRKIETE